MAWASLKVHFDSNSDQFNAAYPGPHGLGLIEGVQDAAILPSGSPCIPGRMAWASLKDRHRAAPVAGIRSIPGRMAWASMKDSVTGVCWGDSWGIPGRMAWASLKGISEAPPATAGLGIPGRMAWASLKALFMATSTPACNSRIPGRMAWASLKVGNPRAEWRGHVPYPGPHGLGLIEGRV